MIRANNQGKAYTAEEIETMVRMFNTGSSLQHIAEAMGRTGSGIVGKLQQQGIIQVHRDGHYYPVPQTPWVMWQEIKTVNKYMEEDPT